MSSETILNTVSSSQHTINAYSEANIINKSTPSLLEIENSAAATLSGCFLSSTKTRFEGNNYSSASSGVRAVLNTSSRLLSKNKNVHNENENDENNHTKIQNMSHAARNEILVASGVSSLANISTNCNNKTLETAGAVNHPLSFLFTNSSGEIPSNHFANILRQQQNTNNNSNSASTPISASAASTGNPQQQQNFHIQQQLLVEILKEQNQEKNAQFFVVGDDDGKTYNRIREREQQEEDQTSSSSFITTNEELINGPFDRSGENNSLVTTNKLFTSSSSAQQNSTSTFFNRNLSAISEARQKGMNLLDKMKKKKTQQNIPPLLLTTQAHISSASSRSASDNGGNHNNTSSTTKKSNNNVQFAIANNNDGLSSSNPNTTTTIKKEVPVQQQQQQQPERAFAFNTNNNNNTSNIITASSAIAAPSTTTTSTTRMTQQQLIQQASAAGNNNRFGGGVNNNSSSSSFAGAFNGNNTSNNLNNNNSNKILRQTTLAGSFFNKQQQQQQQQPPNNNTNTNTNNTTPYQQQQQFTVKQEPGLNRNTNANNNNMMMMTNNNNNNNFNRNPPPSQSSLPSNHFGSLNNNQNNNTTPGGFASAKDQLIQNAQNGNRAAQEAVVQMKTTGLGGVKGLDQNNKRFIESRMRPGFNPPRSINNNNNNFQQQQPDLNNNSNNNNNNMMNRVLGSVVGDPNRAVKPQNQNDNNQGKKSQKNNDNKNDDEDIDLERIPEDLLLPDGSVPEELQKIETNLVIRIHKEILGQRDGVKKITWDDVIGLDHARGAIDEAVIWPLLQPQLYNSCRDRPRGLLFFGPPGTGKTMLAKAIATEAACTFFSISSSSLMSKWIGEGEKLVRALFAVAHVKQPSVVFVDEIDSLLTTRTEGEQDAMRRMKTEFLVHLDGVGTKSDDLVLIIGATNRPEELDEAARRRLEKRLYIPLPNLQARVAMLKYKLGTVRHTINDDQFLDIGRKLKKCSGDDVTKFCQNAAGVPLREAMKQKQLEIEQVLKAEDEQVKAQNGGVLPQAYVNSGRRERKLELMSEKIPEETLRAVTYEDCAKLAAGATSTVSEGELTRYRDWNKQFGTFDIDEEDESENRVK